MCIMFYVSWDVLIKIMGILTKNSTLDSQLGLILRKTLKFAHLLMVRGA